MIFKYQVLTSKDNESKSGKIEAINRQDAQRQLEEKEYIVVKLDEHKENALLTSNIGVDDLIKFTYEISLYLSANMTIDRALHNLSKKKQKRRISEFVMELKEKVAMGESLSESIKKQKILKIPNFYIESIKVSEKRNKLQETLEEIYEFMEMEREYNGKITQALIYPSFITLVGIIISSVLMTVIVPKIITIYKNINQELPKMTQIVINISQFMQENKIILILATIMIIAGAMIGYKQNKKIRYLFDYIKIKIPIVGKMEQMKELIKYSQMIKTLTKSGLPVDKSMRMAKEVVENAVIKKDIEMVQLEIDGGKSIMEAFRKSENIIEEFKENIEIAEQTNQIINVMEVQEKYFKKRIEKNLKTFASLAEPISMLLVGGVIGIIMISIMYPILTMQLN